MFSLEESIKSIVKKTIWNDYRHIRLPQAALAIVTKGGTPVNLKILDENERIDEQFSEIPDVYTEQSFETGDKVVITFLYGKSEMPVILRKWKQ